MATPGETSLASCVRSAAGSGPSGVSSRGEEVGDAMGEGVGLAGAGPGEQHQQAAALGYSLRLLERQTCEQALVLSGEPGRTPPFLNRTCHHLTG